jgi:MoxR-like ATPase
VPKSLDQLRQRLTDTVLGAEEPAFFLTTALLAGGHVLIQGAPGIGKTSLAKALAHNIGGTFRRIQFTPDLLPADILGYSMFNQATHEFEFVEGPIFSNLVLADEINRTSPRIQSALLECMNEGQVSIDGQTRDLGRPFTVIATQNNRYAAGTFPLPEPQLDRFLVSVEMRLPKSATQAEILKLHAQSSNNGSENPSDSANDPDEVILPLREIPALQDRVLEMPVSEPVCHYMVALCDAARRHRQISNDLSARASIALMRAAQAAAFLAGHEAVFPDDVKRVAKAVLAHRFSPADEETVESSRRARVVAVLDEILAEVPVP